MRMSVHKNPYISRAKSGEELTYSRIEDIINMEED
tara:strand:- start:192 stop:296 length:105 start_codon:yes stop_codon:yes gene_type:complete